MNLKQIITDLRSQGKTVKEIAQFTGRTVGSINYFVHKYNLANSRKGCSYMARNRTAGGTLIIRISKELHKQLADYCESIDQSINKFVTDLIQEAVK